MVTSERSVVTVAENRKPSYKIIGLKCFGKTPRRRADGAGLTSMDTIMIRLFLDLLSFMLKPRWPLVFGFVDVESNAA